MNSEKLNKNKKILIGISSAVIVLVAIVLFVLLGRNTEYTVTFDSNGGSLVDSVTVKKNDLLEKPEDPTRENYVFAGWYYNDELYNFNAPVKCDMTLVAKWMGTLEITGIRLDRTKLTLGVGEKTKFIATIMPENTKEESLIWSSSNPDVVSVDQNGNITALKPGTVTITVMTKDGKHKTVAEVTVKQEIVKVTGISLNKTRLEMNVYDTSVLVATVTPNNATDKGVKWSSSNSSVASVDASGRVTARSAGTATITVTTNDGNYTATCTVIVSSVGATGVSLNKSSLNLYVGDGDTLVATVTPNNATNKGVKWSSSNTNVATVDDSGRVTAQGVGTAVITVTTDDGNHTASCTVTVTERPASYSVTFTPIIQEGTGAILQYSILIKKNSSEFTGYDKVVYDGKPTGSYLAADRYNTNITTATIILSDGERVTATVIYNN